MPREAGVALLMEIAPDIAEWKVALGPRRRQRRPDVVAELCLVDRQPPERRLVARGQRVEHRARDRVGRLEGLLDRDGGPAAPHEGLNTATPDSSAHERRIGSSNGGSGRNSDGPSRFTRCGYDVQPRVQSSAGAGGTAPMKVTASKKPSFGG